MQSTLATGLMPGGHGAVANGWYFRDLAEVWLWRQSNRLIAGEKIWEAGRRRDPDFTCAKMFWWYNMYATADWSATPRPMYPRMAARYRTITRIRPSCMTSSTPNWVRSRCSSSGDRGRHRLEPVDRAGHHARAGHAQADVDTLLSAAPRLQPAAPRPDLEQPRLQRDLQEIDGVCGELIEQAERDGARIVVVSEYGITPVSDAVHINRALREAGLIQVRLELGRELLDAGRRAPSRSPTTRWRTSTSSMARPSPR